MESFFKLGRPGSRCAQQRLRKIGFKCQLCRNFPRYEDWEAGDEAEELQTEDMLLAQQLDERRAAFERDISTLCVRLADGDHTTRQLAPLWSVCFL